MSLEQNLDQAMMLVGYGVSFAFSGVVFYLISSAIMESSKRKWQEFREHARRLDYGCNGQCKCHKKGGPC